MAQLTEPKHKFTEEEIEGHTAGDPKYKNPEMQLVNTQLKHPRKPKKTQNLDLRTTIQQNEG